MIVATAGHVDHGKTSLVKQLTGVDTDRLEEEKRRGLSINLGYAYLPREGKPPVGFIDVPGHQRFVNTMISGVSGIDLALLVVAADDGVMPQTREHLDVLNLMGVQRVAPVVTKIDRVDTAQIDRVAQQCAGLLVEHEFETLPAFLVDNISGEGVVELRQYIANQTALARPAPKDQFFYLSIDRAFNLKGSGLVVTGTVSSGEVAVGDTVRVEPGGHEARVRSLRVQDEEAGVARAGQRCALNLTGDLHKDDIQRGDAIVLPNTLPVTRCIEARFALLPNAAFSLKHYAPVKVHIGAKRLAGRLCLVGERSDRKRIEPGKSTYVQLELQEAICCYAGQRFVLRDQGEACVLGGGEILNPVAQKAGRAKPQRLALLDALATKDIALRLGALANTGEVIDLDAFAKAQNVQLNQIQSVQLPAVRRFETRNRPCLVSVERWQSSEELLLKALQDFHQQRPQEDGIAAPALMRRLEADNHRPLLQAALTELLQRKSVVLSDGKLSAANHQKAVPSEEQQCWQRLHRVLERSGSTIPLFSELVEQHHLSAETLTATIRNAIKRCDIYRVSERRVALAQQLLHFALELMQMEKAHEDITVVGVKQRWGTGRNLTVELLEYFDSIRFTQRQGQIRKILDPQLPEKYFEQ